MRKDGRRSRHTRREREEDRRKKKGRAGSCPFLKNRGKSSEGVEEEYGGGADCYGPRELASIAQAHPRETTRIEPVEGIQGCGPEGEETR